MKQRKYYSNFETFFEVTFGSHEHEDFRDEKPTTHTAVVYFDGYWFYCILIDGQEANSLCYRSAKAAVRNSHLLS